MECILCLLVIYTLMYRKSNRGRAFVPLSLHVHRTRYTSVDGAVVVVIASFLAVLHSTRISAERISSGKRESINFDVNKNIFNYILRLLCFPPTYEYSFKLHCFCIYRHGRSQTGIFEDAQIAKISFSPPSPCPTVNTLYLYNDDNIKQFQVL